MTQVNREVSNWRSTLIFGVAALLAVGCANIATANPVGGEGGRHMQRMADDLNLSAQQRQQFKQIHTDSRTAGQSIHEAMKKNRDALRMLDPGAKDYSAQVARLADEKAELVKQMVIHHSEVRAQIYAILTPAQRTKAAEMKTNFRKGGKPGRGGMDRGGRGHCGRQ